MGRKIFIAEMLDARGSRVEWIAQEFFGVESLSVSDGVIWSLVVDCLIKIIIDYGRVFFGIFANISRRRDAIEMNLVESCSFRTHPRVFSSSHTIMEDLALDTGVCIIAILLWATEGGTLQKNLQLVWLIVLFFFLLFP